MPSFSKASEEKLSQCHPDLQTLFNEVIKHFDCTILVGYRGEEEQNKAFEEGKSRVRFPDGDHNKMPSEAVDVSPYPIDWKNTKRFYYFAGFVMCMAEFLQYAGVINSGIGWGGDWDGDKDLDDQTLYDLVHFYIKE